MIGLQVRGERGVQEAPSGASKTWTQAELESVSNEIKADRTNILRLYGVLEKSPEQLVYYDPGVGTFGAENAWLRFWRKGVESGIYLDKF